MKSRKALLLAAVILFALVMFGENVHAADNPAIWLQGGNQPAAQLQEGAGFQPKGVVTASGSAIKNIYIAVVNTETGAVAADWLGENLGVYRFDLSGAKLALQNVRPGSYQYIVAVRNHAGQKIEPIRSGFRITAHSTLKITGGQSAPVVKQEGDASFRLTGALHSNYPIQNVYAAIYQGDQAVAFWMKTGVGAYSFDLNSAVMDISGLAAGSYRYKLSVRDTVAKKDLLDIPFTVSKLWLEGFACQSAITQGDQLSIAGSVISKNLNLRTCYLAIRDSSGVIVSDRVAEPNTGSLALGALVPDTTGLPEGAYTLAVAARNAAEKKDLVTVSFTVNRRESPYDTRARMFLDNPSYANGAAWGARGPIASQHSGTGCCAYAADFVAIVHQKGFTDGTDFTSVNEIRTGDVIHVNSKTHWIVILYRDGNRLVTAEGNWTGGRVVVSDSVYTICNGQLYRDNKYFRPFDLGRHYM